MEENGEDIKDDQIKLLSKLKVDLND